MTKYGRNVIRTLIGRTIPTVYPVRITSGSSIARCKYKSYSWSIDCSNAQRMKRNEYSDAFQNGYSATRRFLLSRGAAIDEAEEIAQAAWARGWEYRDQLRDPSMVSFWVNSIARNLFRARFRTPDVIPLEGIDPSYNMSLEDQIEVRRILDLCPKRDRMLLEKSLEGYSAEEMARDEGISSTGIRVRMLRIRQGIREQLAVAA